MQSRFDGLHTGKHRPDVQAGVSVGEGVGTLIRMAQRGRAPGVLSEQPFPMNDHPVFLHNPLKCIKNK